MPHYGSGSLHALPRTRVLGAGRHAGVGLPTHPHPVGHARPHPILHTGKVGLGEWDEGLGKFSFKKAVAKVAHSAQAGVRSVKGTVKVAGGAIGIKHGLTAKQLKKAGIVRKIGLAVAGVAGAVLLAPLAIAAAGHLTGLGAAGAGGLIGKIKNLRKAAGLPPVSADTVANCFAQEKAKDPNASDEVLTERTNEILAKQVAEASPAAVAEAQKVAREMVPAEVAQQQIAAAPPAQQAALASAVDDATTGVGGDWKKAAAMAALVALALLYTRAGKGARR